MRISLLTLFLLCSCLIYGQEKHQIRTQRTQNLLNSLRKTANKGKFLFGHHDDTVYGLEWRAEPDHSDVKSVCGDYPAFYSEHETKFGDSKEKANCANLSNSDICNKYNKLNLLKVNKHLFINNF